MSDSPSRVERWWDGTLGGKGVLVGGDGEGVEEMMDWSNAEIKKKGSRSRKFEIKTEVAQ